MNTRLVTTLVLACAAPLGSCSFGPRAPSIPDTAWLQQQYADVAALPGAPPDYVGAGYASAYKACGDYFDALIQMQNVVGFSRDVTKSIGIAGTGFSALLKQATLAQRQVTRWSTGVTLVDAGLGAFEDRALMTPYPSETKTLILRAMTAYEQLNPPGAADSRARAYGFVTGYAEICTYSGVTRYAKQALANAEPKAGVAPSSTGSDQRLFKAIATTLGDASTPLSVRQVAALYYHLVSNPTWDAQAPAAVKQRQALIAELPEALRGALLTQGEPKPVAQIASLASLQQMLTLVETSNDDVRRDVGVIAQAMTQPAQDVPVARKSSDPSPEKGLAVEGFLGPATPTTVPRLVLPSSNQPASNARQEVRF